MSCTNVFILHVVKSKCGRNKFGYCDQHYKTDNLFTAPFQKQKQKLEIYILRDWMNAVIVLHNVV